MPGGHGLFASFSALEGDMNYFNNETAMLSQTEK